MNRKYYLAYGSNLNEEQMAWRCPTASVVGVADLNDWRLLFRGSKTGSYLTIEPCKGHTIPVAIWSITPEDELSLDHYEGFPTFYRKEIFPFEGYDFNGEPFSGEALVYIMTEGRPLGIPSDLYVDTCIEGYQDFGFDYAPLEEALLYSCNHKEVKSA